MSCHIPPQIPDYERLRQLTARLPDLDPDDVTAVSLLRAVGAELTARLEQSLVCHGISEGRLRVLGQLLCRDQPTSHSQIAEGSGITRATVTGLVDGLERDGLVRRVASREDRRISLIELTDEGERWLQSMLPGHLRYLSSLLSGVSPQERDALTALLRKVLSGLQAGPRGSDAAEVDA